MRTHNSKAEVQTKLLEIFRQRFAMNLEAHWQDIQDEHFLGHKIGMAPRDLLYLYHDIEKEFDIKIPEEHIISGNFCNLNNIMEMISNELEGHTSEAIEDSKVS